jgi:hypothetical protein
MGSLELDGETVDSASSGGQFEECVDKLNLTPNISSSHPPNLSLPHHVYPFITLNRSLRRLEFSEVLLGVDTPFDRAVISLQDIAQVRRRTGCASLFLSRRGTAYSFRRPKPIISGAWPLRRSNNFLLHQRNRVVLELVRPKHF